MSEIQNFNGSNVTKELVGNRNSYKNRKRKSGNGTCSTHGNRGSNKKASVDLLGQKAVIVKAASKSVKRKMNENQPPELSKLYRDLKDICIRVEKAEEENQKLFCFILSYVCSCQSSSNSKWINLRGIH